MYNVVNISDESNFYIYFYIYLVNQKIIALYIKCCFIITTDHEYLQFKKLV